jgi:hypothetical protein
VDAVDADGHGHILIVHDLDGGFGEHVAPELIYPLCCTIPMVKADARPLDGSVVLVLQQRRGRRFRLEAEQPVHPDKLA